MSRFLVTGCAGFIGSHLVEALLDDAHEVVGVDVFTDYYRRSSKEANVARIASDSRFSLVEADLVDADLAPLVAETDGIFHLAAQPGVRASWGEQFTGYVENNLVATQRLFEAASREEVRVVFASSSSVYGDAETYPTPEEVVARPISPYGVTKLACEVLGAAYARNRDLDVVTLRYFTVYGPRQRPDMAFTRLVSAIVRGTPFRVFGRGEQSRDFTYVADAVTATYAAMERAPGGAVYNVGGGTEASLREVIEICERIAGRRVKIVHEDPVAGDVRRTAADTTRIRSALGWQPSMRLEDGLRAHLEWAERAIWPRVAHVKRPEVFLASTEPRRAAAGE